MTLFGPILPYFAPPVPVWTSLYPFEPVCNDVCTHFTCYDQFGLIWTPLELFGPVSNVFDRFRLFGTAGTVWALLDPFGLL